MMREVVSEKVREMRVNEDRDTYLAFFEELILLSVESQSLQNATLSTSPHIHHCKLKREKLVFIRLFASRNISMHLKSTYYQ